MSLPGSWYLEHATWCANTCCIQMVDYHVLQTICLLQVYKSWKENKMFEIYSVTASCLLNDFYVSHNEKHKGSQLTSLLLFSTLVSLVSFLVLCTLWSNYALKTHLNIIFRLLDTSPVHVFTGNCVLMWESNNKSQVCHKDICVYRFHSQQGNPVERSCLCSYLWLEDLQIQCSEQVTLVKLQINPGKTNLKGTDRWWMDRGNDQEHQEASHLLSVSVFLSRKVCLLSSADTQHLCWHMLTHIVKFY